MRDDIFYTKRLKISRFRTRRTNRRVYHRKMDRDAFLYPGIEKWHRFGVVDLIG